MHTPKRVNKNGSILGNEEGTAIITALLILLMLTFVAISSTDTTVSEKAVVRSEAIFEKDFYLAESAALEGAQKIENETTPDELLPALLTAGANNENLLVEEDADAPDNDREQLADDVDFSGSIEDAEIQAIMETAEVDSSTYRRVVLKSGSSTSGSSLAMGQSRLYDYMSYGYSTANGGRAMIKIGYKKRF